MSQSSSSMDSFATSRMAERLYKEVCVGLFEKVGCEIIALKAPVSHNKSLSVKGVALEHCNQRPDFIFLGFWLNNNIYKSFAEDVI